MTDVLTFRVINTIQIFGFLLSLAMLGMLLMNLDRTTKKVEANTDTCIRLLENVNHKERKR